MLYRFNFADALRNMWRGGNAVADLLVSSIDNHAGRECPREHGARIRRQTTGPLPQGPRQPFGHASIPGITPGCRHVRRLDVRLAWRDVSAVFSAN